MTRGESWRVADGRRDGAIIAVACPADVSVLFVQIVQGHGREQLKRQVRSVRGRYLGVGTAPPLQRRLLNRSNRRCWRRGKACRWLAHRQRRGHRRPTIHLFFFVPSVLHHGADGLRSFQRTSRIIPPFLQICLGLERQRSHLVDDGGADC